MKKNEHLQKIIFREGKQKGNEMSLVFVYFSIAWLEWKLDCRELTTTITTTNNSIHYHRHYRQSNTS